jgi:AcrR family transcriptional regulator
MTTETPPAQRAARRRMSTEERVAQIVTESASLFDRDGYSKTTMDDIARAVGIAKPTLYHYFSSKEDLLASIHEEFIDLLISEHEQREHLGLDASEQLFEIIADILQLMETHRGHVRVFFENHRELARAAQKEMRAKRDRYETIVEDLFVAGQADGTFRGFDAHIAALALFGMCNWSYQWYQSNGTMRARDIAYQFWGLLRLGVTPRA